MGDLREGATPTHRAAHIAILLRDGRRLTTADVAAITGMTRVGSWGLLTRLSGILPILPDEEGRWHWVGKEDVEIVDDST